MHVHGGDFRRLTRFEITRFAKLRSVRVYPLNWIVLLLVFAVCALDPAYHRAVLNWSVDGHPVEALIRTAALGTRWLPGTGDWNPPTWSLSAEMVGYAAFPLVALWANRLSWFWALIGVALAAMGVLATYQVCQGTVRSNDIGLSGSLKRMTCCFVAGVALSRARMVAPRWIAAHAAWLSFAALSFAMLSILSWRGAVLMQTAFAALIFSLSFDRGPVNRLFGSKLMVLLGRLSFPLYLIHTQALVWLNVHAASLLPDGPLGAIALVAYLAIVAVLSWLLHIGVERPSQALARLWARAQFDKGVLSASRAIPAVRGIAAYRQSRALLKPTR